MRLTSGPDSWWAVTLAIAFVLALLWLVGSRPLEARCVDERLEVKSRYGWQKVEIEGQPVKCN